MRPECQIERPLTTLRRWSAIDPVRTNGASASRNRVAEYRHIRHVDAMAMSEVQRSARLAATKEKARTLAEDTDYLRVLVAQDHLDAPELRRASAVLRRLLVEGVLVEVAGPRIGKAMIRSPDLSPVHRSNEQEAIAFAATAGAKIFGVEMALMMLNAGPMARDVPGYHPDRTVLLSVEHFLKQRVICLHGQWVTRHQIIKYVANVGGGVHSGVALEPEDLLIARMRSAAKVHIEGEQVVITQSLDALSDTPPPLEYARNHIDVLLVELLTTARLVTEAPDTIRLEELIADET